MPPFSGSSVAGQPACQQNFNLWDWVSGEFSSNYLIKIDRILYRGVELDEQVMECPSGTIRRRREWSIIQVSRLRIQTLQQFEHPKASTKSCALTTFYTESCWRPSSFWTQDSRLQFRSPVIIVSKCYTGPAVFRSAVSSSDASWC